MREEMRQVWNLFVDQKNGLFVMAKADYDDLPAIAADALRIINDEFEIQAKGKK